MIPNVRKRFLGVLDRLDSVLTREPEWGREELRGILGAGERIKLLPDEIRPLPVGRVLAGIGSAAAKCGNCGSGGRILLPATIVRLALAA